MYTSRTRPRITRQSFRRGAEGAAPTRLGQAVKEVLAQRPVSTCRIPQRTLFTADDSGFSSSVARARRLENTEWERVKTASRGLPFINFAVKTLKPDSPVYGQIFHTALRDSYAAVFGFNRYYGLEQYFTPESYERCLTIAFNSAFRNDQILNGDNQGNRRLEALISLVQKLSYLHKRRHERSQDELDLKLHKAYKSISRSLEEIFGAIVKGTRIQYTYKKEGSKRKRISPIPTRTRAQAIDKIIGIAVKLDRESEVKDRIASGESLIGIAKELLEQKVKIIPLIDKFLRQNEVEVKSPPNSELDFPRAEASPPHKTQGLLFT